jgi:hypothetical protein
MNAWVWSGLILLIFIALLLLLLASYLRLETSLSEGEQSFRLRWLGNKVVVNIMAREVTWRLFGWRILHKPFKAGAKPKEEKKEQRESVSLKSLLEERQRLRTLWRYFKDSLRVEHFELNVYLATPDPVWTGMLYGLASSFVYPLKAIYPRAQLHIKADFVRELPRGTFNAKLGVRVFRIVVLGLKAFPLIRKLRQYSRKEYRYGSPNPSQGNRRGYASSS